MRPGRRDALILGGVAAAAAAGGIATAVVLQSRNGAAELLNTPFQGLSGEQRRLADWRGKPLLCNFWATWCAPCREEIPLLGAAHLAHAATGFQVVGIAIDNVDNVRKFAANVTIHYPVLLAGPEAISLMHRLGNPSGGLPFTVLLDRRGRVAGQHLGAYSPAQLQQALAPLVQ